MTALNQELLAGHLQLISGISGFKKMRHGCDSPATKATTDRHHHSFWWWAGSGARVA